MTTNQETMTRPRWPAEGEAFAAKRGLANYLPQVWQMTRQVFPQAHQLALRLEEDAETPDDWRIIVHVAAQLDERHRLGRHGQGQAHARAVGVGHEGVALDVEDRP